MEVGKPLLERFTEEAILWKLCGGFIRKQS